MEKDKEKDIIDYGEVSVPKSWEEIDLKTFQDIERYYADKDKQFNIIEVLHIVLNKDKDWVMSLPSEFLDMILEKLVFLQEQPEVKEPANKIKIDGEAYSIHFENQLKTGEYIAADTVLKNDKNNIALLLAILCRKDGEVYDSKFENEVVPERMKMFEQQPVINILPIAAFFLTLYGQSAMLTQLYSKVEEAINHTAYSIENSDKIGAFKRLYLKWRITQLQKSMKSINNTSRTRSHSLRTLFRKAKWKKLRTSSRRH